MIRTKHCLLILLLLPPLARAEPFLGKSVEEWRHALVQGSDAARRQAAFALGQLGIFSRDAIPELKLALRDPKASVRNAAAFSLGELAKAYPPLEAEFPIVGELARLLESDTDPLVRRSAGYALGCLGSSAWSARRQLERGIDDPEPVVRCNVAWALGRIGTETATLLRKALRDPEPIVQRDAAASLASFPAADIRPALAELSRTCQVDNSEVRRATLRALQKVVGPDTKQEAIPIGLALRDEDEEVRRFAALALAQIGGPESKPALPILQTTLRHPEAALRLQAAAGLGQLGEDALPAVGDLLRLLDDPDPRLRAQAAMSLGTTASAIPEQVFEPLLKLAADPKESPPVRLEAVVALAHLPQIPTIRRYLPEVLDLFGNPKTDSTLRERLVWVLRSYIEKLEDLAVLPTMEKVVAEPKTPKNRMVRYDCAALLATIRGPEVSAATLDTLHEFLQDTTIQIFVKKDANVEASGTETGAGKVETKDVGKGDGRVLALRSLRFVVRDFPNFELDPVGLKKVRGHPGLMPQIRRLAESADTDPTLRELARGLAKKVAK